MVNKLMNKYERNGNKSKEVARAREETVAVSEDRTTKALSTKVGQRDQGYPANDPVRDEEGIHPPPHNPPCPPAIPNNQSTVMFHLRNPQMDRRIPPRTVNIFSFDERRPGRTSSPNSGWPDSAITPCPGHAYREHRGGVNPWARPHPGMSQSTSMNPTDRAFRPESTENEGENANGKDIPDVSGARDESSSLSVKEIISDR
ncbi:hypothetical protein ALC53_02573 [Atta colombica]|uniref:Uncharacterized protein n=1 Tax=Atta colombica TaxID=520822 RepID=A0A195BQD9_9HYME|nr:hypothetical protein ALC53_02573 [Atta colombica]